MVVDQTLLVISILLWIKISNILREGLCGYTETKILIQRNRTTRQESDYIHHLAQKFQEYVVWTPEHVNIERVECLADLSTTGRSSICCWVVLSLISLRNRPGSVVIPATLNDLLEMI